MSPSAPHGSRRHTLPPLSSRKSPGLAAALGFAFGVTGLALYFWMSWRDLALSFAFGLFARVATLPLSRPTALAIMGVVLGSYGYLRARSSNAKLAAATLVPRPSAAAA